MSHGPRLQICMICKTPLADDAESGGEVFGADIDQYLMANVCTRCYRREIAKMVMEAERRKEDARGQQRLPLL